jgi:hypothetical protein
MIAMRLDVPANPTSPLHGTKADAEKKKGLQAEACNPFIFLLNSGSRPGLEPGTCGLTVSDTLRAGLQTYQRKNLARKHKELSMVTQVDPSAYFA